MKALILICIVFIYSCSGSLTESPKIVEVTGFDFTKYTTLGFLFTPEGYPGEYESIGIIRAQIFPEVKEAKGMSITKEIMKDYNVVSIAGSNWIIEKIKPEMAIEEIFVTAKNMGADAIINFDARISPKQNGNFTFYGYEVSGFAIKRK